MKPIRILIAFIATLSFAPLVHAQFSVGAAFTDQKLVFDPDIVPGTLGAGSYNLTGTTLNAQLEVGDTFRFGMDIRGVVTRASSIGTNTFGIGPRFAVALPVAHLRPYVEGLVGGAYVRSYSSSLYTGRYADFTAAIGVDTAITPHVDWRIFEYSHSTVSGEDIRNQFSTGILYRFERMPSWHSHS